MAPGEERCGAVSTLPLGPQQGSTDVPLRRRHTDCPPRRDWCPDWPPDRRPTTLIPGYERARTHGHTRPGALPHGRGLRGTVTAQEQRRLGQEDQQ